MPRLRLKALIQRRPDRVADKVLSEVRRRARKRIFAELVDELLREHQLDPAEIRALIRDGSWEERMETILRAMDEHRRSTQTDV